MSETAETAERKEKFTPGPWTVKGPCCSLTRPGIDGDLNGNKRSIIIIGTDEDRRGIDTEANAALIAAAPDMYAALENAVKDYGKPGGPWNVPSEPGTWIHSATSALAKARGES